MLLFWTLLWGYRSFTSQHLHVRAAKPVLSKILIDISSCPSTPICYCNVWYWLRYGTSNTLGIPFTQNIFLMFHVPRSYRSLGVVMKWFSIGYILGAMLTRLDV